MARSSAEKQPEQQPPPGERLDSWKEIATYLNRDVTTVQRWEKREGMPVHRHQHDRMGSVYAYRAELDQWATGRNLSRTAEVKVVTATANEAERSSHRATLPGIWIGVSALVALALVVAAVWLYRADYWWRNPMEGAQFQTITDFDALQDAATISRDGHLIAFLSDRDGQMDVWLTQTGSGQFHNLTHGSAPELRNPLIRSLGFTPDAAFVTYWTRRNTGANNGIGVWAVPTLGGQPKPYLEGAAEFDWSAQGTLAYHTSGPGDPLFVSDAGGMRGREIYRTAEGQHGHFPLWSPDGKYLYLVQGVLPDDMDIWRVPVSGGNAERITQHNAHVGYPVFLNRKTLLYLEAEPGDDSGDLFAIDVERRKAHRLTSGPERYTSLAADADGSRLVLTLATSKTSLLRTKLAEVPGDNATPISLTTRAGESPRIGPGYLLYVGDTGGGEGIWKLANGASTQLWSGESAQIVGRPAIAANGQIAFSVKQHGRSLLFAMQADGTNVRIVTDTLDLKGNPAWAPDGNSIVTAAEDNGIRHLFTVPLNGGRPATLVREYSTDPAYSPDGSALVYSGPDVGTRFQVKAVNARDTALPLRSFSLSRGARRLAFSPNGRQLVFLKGEIEHKNLWEIDLNTGQEKQLTDFPPDFTIRDFDLSPDGQDVVLDRAQRRSDVLLVTLGKH